jgi:hypothetical protein
MNDNVYQAPIATLAVDTKDVEPFFAVGVGKLTIMHLLSFGYYDVYWFYRHFKQQKLKSDESIWPAARAIFYVVFIYSLFSRISKTAQAQLGSDAENLRPSAWLWMLLLLLSYIAGAAASIAAVGGATEGNLSQSLATISLVSLGLGLLVLVLPVFFLRKAQSLANQLLSAESVESNSKLTALNYLWIGLGVLSFVVNIINTLAVLRGVAAVE